MKKMSLFLMTCMMLMSVFSCSGDTVYITISPKNYDFDVVRYGESAATDFIFTNKYKVDITITAVDITGASLSPLPPCRLPLCRQSP